MSKKSLLLIKISFVILLLYINNNVSAQIIISPATYDFGDVEIWDNQPANFNIKNNTDEVITFLPTYPTKNVQIYNPVNKLLPGESVDIQLFYYTEEKGIFKEWFEIFSSFDDEPLELKIKGKIKNMGRNVLTACPGSISKREIEAIRKLRSKNDPVKNSSINSNVDQMVFVQEKSKPEKNIEELNNNKEKASSDKKSINKDMVQVSEPTVITDNSGYKVIIIDPESDTRSASSPEEITKIETKETDIYIPDDEYQKNLMEKNRPVYEDNLIKRKKIKKRVLITDKKEDNLLDKQRRTLTKNKKNEKVLTESKEELLIDSTGTEEPEFVAYTVKESEQADKPVKVLSPKNKITLLSKRSIKVVPDQPLSVNEYAPNNLLFLIDVSLSMKDDGKLPALKRSINRLTGVLRDIDQLTIITYATEANILFESMEVGNNNHKAINDLINGLKASGRTNGVSGINLAYDKINEHYIDNANNQIILATDGLFNQSKSVSSTVKENEMLDIISNKASQSNVKLSIIGFGDNKKGADTMKKIAKNGNGNLIMIKNNNDINGVAKEIMYQSKYD